MKWILFLLAMFLLVIFQTNWTAAEYNVSVGVANIAPSSVTPADLAGSNIINGGQNFTLTTTVTDSNGCADIDCTGGCSAKCWSSMLGEAEPASCSDCNCITSATYALQSGCTASTRQINFTGLQFTSKTQAGPVLCVVTVRDAASNVKVSAVNPFNLEPGSGASADSVTIRFPPSPPGTSSIPAIGDVSLSNPTNTIGSMDMSMTSPLQKVGASGVQIPQSKFSMFSTQEYTPFLSSDTLLYVDFDGRAPTASSEGTVGIWHFGEGSGQTAADATSNNNLATLGSTSGTDSSDPTWTEGRFGDGLKFDGTADYVNVSYSSTLTYSHDFSVSAWVKLPHSTSNQAILSHNSQNSASGWWFLKRRSGLDNALAMQWQNGVVQVVANTSLPADTWTHVAFTLSGTTGTLYQNGMAVGSGTFSALTADAVGTLIGARYMTESTRDSFANGIIDEAAIYNRALTPEEIGKISGIATVDGKAPSAVVYVTPAEGRFGPKTVFFENFDSTSQWSVVSGSWSVSSGEYVGTAAGRTLAGDASWSDYMVEANMVERSGNRTGLSFRDDGTTYDSCFLKKSSNTVGFRYANTTQTATTAFSFSYNSPYKMKVEVFGNRVRCFVNDILMYDVVDTGMLSTGKVGLSIQDTGTTAFDNVRVLSSVGGAYFNGSAYMSFGNSSTYSPSAITVMAWVKTMDSTANPGHCGGRYGQIVGKGADNQWQLRMGGDTTACRPNFGIKNSSAFVQVTGSTNLTNGAWYHLAGTYDGSNVKIYMNGVEKGSTPATGSIQSTTLPLSIGARSADGSTFSYNFYGMVDEVKVFNRALSAAEIQDAYNGNYGTAFSSSSQAFLPNAPFGSCSSDAKAEFSGYISIPSATPYGSFGGTIGFQISGGNQFSGWSYWRSLALNETAGVPRVLEPIDVYVPAGSAAKSDCSDFRVLDSGFHEIASQVHDCTSGNGNVTFLAYVPANRGVTYRIYYGNPSAPSPYYSTDLRVTASSGNVTVENGKVYANYGKESYCGLVDFWRKDNNIDVASQYGMETTLGVLNSGCTSNYQILRQGPIFVDVYNGSSAFNRYYAFNSFVDSINTGTTTTNTAGYNGGTSFAAGFEYLGTPWTSWWIGNNANVSSCTANACPTLTVDKTLLMFSKETSPAFSLYMVGPSGFNQWDANEFTATGANNAEHANWWNSGTGVTVRNVFRFGLSSSTTYSDIADLYTRFNNPISVTLGSQQTNTG